MATVNISSIAGADLTWDTASFAWAASDKTWATAQAGDSFTAAVTEDTVALAEKAPKSAGVLKKEAAAVADLCKKNVVNVEKQTLAVAELARKAAGKTSKETLAWAEAHTELVAFARLWAESLAAGDACAAAVAFVRVFAEAASLADLAKKTTHKLYRWEGFIVATPDNRWVQTTPFIYNNLGGTKLPSTLALLEETYNGNPVWRLTMTPTTSDAVSNLQTYLHSHGIYGAYTYYSAGCTYLASVKWRYVDHSDLEVANTASNIAGWGDTTTVDLGDGWFESYNTWSSFTVHRGDYKFFSFRCPSAVLNESVSIDFTCPEVYPVMATASELLRDLDVVLPAQILGVSDASTRGVGKVSKQTLACADVMTQGVAFRRTLAEALALAELDKWGAAKKLLEALAAADSHAEAAQFHRAVAELVAVAELAKKGVTNVEHEALGVAEANANTVSFVRALAELVALAETSRRAPGLVQDEALAVLEQGQEREWGDLGGYTWDTLPDTWGDSHEAAQTFALGKRVLRTLAVAEQPRKGNSKSICESLYLAEVFCKVTGRLFAEAFGVAETHTETVQFRRTLAEAVALAEKLQKGVLRPLAESLALSDTYVDYISFVLRAVESVALVEAATKHTGLLRSQTLGLSDSAAKTVAQKANETLGCADAARKSLASLWREAATVTEVPKKSVASVKKETMAVAEAASRQTAKKSLESLGVSEVYWDYIGFVLRVVESLLVAELPKKGVALPRQENVAVADQAKKAPQKVSKATLTTADQWGREVGFDRAFVETVTLVEKLAKQLKITEAEVMRFVSEVLRHANAVLSDIVLKNGEMTMDEFVALATPEGFESFRDFIAGDLEYQDALVKIILEAGVTTGRPLIDQWTLNVDVPDVPDRGTANVTASTTRVTFNRAYHYPPEVTVTVKGGTGEVPTPRIAGEITKTYFDVELVNSSGALVAGVVGWTSIGC